MIAIVTGGLIALLITLLATRFFIEFLARRGYGQFIRDDGPTTHRTKRGTPNMGGVVVITAAVVGYFVAHLVGREPLTVTGLLVLGLLVATGVLGFLDDWSKISHQRSLGLTARAKLAGQGLISVGFGVLALQFPAAQGNVGAHPASVHISAIHDISWLRLPAVIAVVWMALLIMGSSNAVNLTDGLDGLATGASTMVFGAFTLIGIFQRNQWCLTGERGPRCYDVRDPLDTAVVAACLAAACFGFLWWNAKPARIFLGDTGSLALGAAMGGLAIVSRTELLLVVLGMLFVIETVSVMIQVGYFKATHGKRVFKMTPLHHHFELLGWDEVTVVIRFWIIAGVSVGAGLMLWYGGWLTGW